MSDAGALQILRDSVGRWNEWRANQPKVDLRMAPLSNEMLAGANFSDCDLSKADFEGSDLRGANFQRAVLSGVSFTTRVKLRDANFSGADFSPQHALPRLSRGPNPGVVTGLELAEFNGKWPAHLRVSFRETDLRGAHFVKTDLRTLDFVDADLRRAVFRQAVLENVDLHWANLEGADFREADLRAADFNYCNLSNADLRRADLEGADMRLVHFKGANLLGANLRGIKFEWLTDATELLDARNLLLAYVSADLAAELQFPDGHNENVGKLDFRSYRLERANLEAGDFRGASFESTKCAGARLKNAVLVSANLRCADLRGADVRQANLKWADLFGADLRGAFLDDAQLTGANLQRAKLEGSSGLTLDQLKSATNHVLAQLDPLHLADLGLPSDHRERIEANDLEGYDLHDADLRKADLSGAMLARANLSGARLDEANLREATLENAILVEASAVKTDFTKAVLAGAKLRDADFQDADLRDIQILSTRQLAGTNVSGAKLPDTVKSFEALLSIKESSENSRKIFLSMLLLSAYSWLTIAATKDSALLTNTGMMQLPIIQTQIPIGWFYWVAPVLLLGVFLYCHFYLQNLWEELAQLPAYFPDGRPLHQRVYPWLLNSIARVHFARLRSERGLLSYAQFWTTIILTWWVAPMTQILFWARYLPRHEWVGTALNITLAGFSITAALAFQRLAASTLEGSTDEFKIWPLKESYKLLVPSFGPAIFITLLLAVLSFGALESGPGYASWDPRTWSPAVLRALYVPEAARLTEEEVSIPPANWISDRPDFEQVKGAHLANRDLRNAQARHAFLVKADLSGANLQFADLRDADLRRAILTGAVLRGANLTGARLDGAVLQGCICGDAVGFRK